MTANEKMTKAKSAIIIDNPFFGSLLLRLEFCADNSFSTMATNGKALKYNEAFVLSLSMSDLKGCIIHEILHCTFQHINRRGTNDHETWNRACDYVINPIVFESGYTLPDGILYEYSYAGKTAENVYSILYQAKQDSQSSQQDSQWKNEPWNIGEAMDSSESESERQSIEQEWKINTMQAVNMAKSQGMHVPTALSRMVSEMLNPALPWQEILRRFIENSALNDYSWQLPNRRHIANGLYLPGIQSDELGNIVLAIDTSGSVSQRELDQFASEISEILEAFNSVKLTVLYCDTDIRNVQEFTSNDLPIELEPMGFGDTDFRPPFLWIEENDIEPIAMLYFTDGYCNKYPEEPSFPVLWIGTVEFEPRFGEFAYLY